MSDRNSQSVFNFTRRRTLSLGVSAAAAAALLTRPRGAAAVTVDINQANVQPMPIAVSDFVGGGSGDAQQITKWVAAHYTARTVGGETVYDLGR